MYKNFNLTESEKKEILNKHKAHGYQKPLNEEEDELGNGGVKFIDDNNTEFDWAN